MTKRKYITVTLTARIDGECVVLLDAHGRKIAAIATSDAICASDSTVSSIETQREWQHAFSGMMLSLGNKHRRLTATPWQSKIGVWMKSLRWRRNRQRAQVKTRSKKYSEASRPDWTAAVSCLLHQYNGRLHEARLRKSNPWRLWAQTVAGNHRKKGVMYADCSIQKEAARAGDCQAVGKETGRSEVQMRIDWAGSEPIAFVA